MTNSTSTSLVNALSGDGYIVPAVVRSPLAKEEPKPCLLKIAGVWYDVSKNNFINRHPGGDILREFNKKDCTVLMRMWHPKKVYENIQRYCPKIEMVEEETQEKQDSLHPADRKYLEFYSSLEKRGFISDKGHDEDFLSKKFFYERCCLLIGFLMASFILFRITPTEGQEFFRIMGCFCLFQVWYQGAGILHDSSHNQYFDGNIQKNRLIGLIAGAFSGISSSFWRWEHIEHHVFTNVYEEDAEGKTRNCDPQQTEDVWFNDVNLVEKPKEGEARSFFTQLILSIQHYLFFTLMVCGVARIGITLDAYIPERRLSELIGLVFHVMYQAVIFASMNSWSEILYYYWISAMFFSILAFQLQANHMSNTWFEKKQETETGKVAQISRHIEACTNISSPRVLDAFWGGLNFHIEHHLFPRLKREYYRQLNGEVKDFIKSLRSFDKQEENENGETAPDETIPEYKEKAWGEALYDGYLHLGSIRGLADIRDCFDLGREHEHGELQEMAKMTDNDDDVSTTAGSTPTTPRGRGSPLVSSLSDE